RRLLERAAVERELAQARDVRVVIADVCAELFEQLDDLQRRRLARVADAGPVADAEQRDPRAFDRQPGRVQRTLSLLDAVVGHLLVDLAGARGELGRNVELARAPAQIERVDGQAVPAHARPRL